MAISCKQANALGLGLLALGFVLGFWSGVTEAGLQVGLAQGLVYAFALVLGISFLHNIALGGILLLWMGLRYAFLPKKT